MKCLSFGAWSTPRTAAPSSMASGSAGPRLVRSSTPVTAPSRTCPPISTAFSPFTASGRRPCGCSGRRGVDSSSVDEDVVVIHTDGGCRPEPRSRRLGAVLRHQGSTSARCVGASPVQTSNNWMELTAPIMALEALTRPVVVHLYTDSTYVRNGITKRVLGWERNGWMTAAKQPVKNVDLWQRLQTACARRRVEWFWVKGHAGVADNELADVLATRGHARSDRPVCGGHWRLDARDAARAPSCGGGQAGSDPPVAGRQGFSNT